ncbi:MAG: hypothetical protein ACFE9I_17620 [Candidatus Hermodarchaeota archaeon]
MGKILRDLWILTEDGLTIFSRVIDPTIGPQVFGGLMSALNTFAESLTEGGMSNFQLSSIRFTIEKKNHFLFVANASNEVKPKKVMNELKKVSKIFFKAYPEEIIKNWSKNIKKFSNFKEFIMDSLDETT